MALYLYNTLGRTLQEFKPITHGKVGMYACGPTVYTFAHIGNLRTFIFEDILRRTMEHLGYEVTHVMNITDVGHLTDDADQGEDKMTRSAREKKMSVWEIAEFYTQAFLNDMKELNLNSPTVICKATDHIDDMIELIKKLEKKGYTYRAGGNIYFDVERFPDYGKLALLDKQELKAGARIQVDEYKRNPRDFVLWFTRSKFDHQAMMWDSPWGRGYPGWHIECSAMSMKYLGEQFDIHCGAIDLVPVHHTNEIAQSEAATGKKWVNYWVHGEFLLMGEDKMAKSAGNFITLKDLKEEGFDPLDYRYFCLGGHYRVQLQFSREALKAARAARLHLTERVKEIRERTSPSELSEIGEKGKSYIDSFRGNLSHDLNIPRCLSDLWGVVKDVELSDAEKLAIILDMDRVLGLRMEEAKREELDEAQLQLIRDREEARRRKDFVRADAMREELKKQGIILEDTPDGTRWKKIE
ncbi:MAG: cysteine--tRNA ligase [Spirochaetes bacterium]|nr:MAG: cysteine--tRNA ligase [Spirochaetota bacterium]